MRGGASSGWLGRRATGACCSPPVVTWGSRACIGSGSPPTGARPPVRQSPFPLETRRSPSRWAGGGRLVYAAQFRDTRFWRLRVRPGAADSGGRPARRFDVRRTHAQLLAGWGPAGLRVDPFRLRGALDSNADGSGLRQMTSMGGPQCGNPQWSPDGQTIVFNSRREGSADLYLLRPTSGEVRRLTSEPSDELEPHWSRDGRWVYFGSDRTGRFEVWEMPAEGGAPVQMTRGGGMTATESLDGRFLDYAKAPVSPTAIGACPSPAARKPG